MEQTNRAIAWCISLAIVLAMTAGANSATITDTYNDSVTPGVFYGSGNANGGFTVERVLGDGIALELGLRAHTRYLVPDDSPAGIMSHGNGTYGNFQAQGYLDPPGPNNESADPSGTLASWNFDFSINTNYNGDSLGGGLLSDFNYLLKIDYDPSSGQNFENFPYVLFLGNSPTGSPNLAQNSENIGFGFLTSNAPQSFSPFASGDYVIKLEAYQGDPLNGGTLVGSSQIDVLVGSVPEPASMAIWGLGALGCAIGAYRRKRMA